MPAGGGLHRDDLQERFLKAYTKKGTITHAAKLSGVSWAHHYRWMKEDPTYPPRLEQAKIEIADRAERAAIKRAIDGYDEPIFQQGIQVGTKRKYSDRLLMFYLKGRRRDVFGDKREITGADGQPLRVNISLPHNERGTGFDTVTD